ncbi:hypothetical protein RQP46_007645 [Phenoliferia psychrophenolica]
MIATLGTQIYDAIIRFKAISPDERHDYLAIRRVAHELEPTLTRGISMELWRNAIFDYCYEHTWLDQTDAARQGVNVSPAYIVAVSVFFYIYPSDAFRKHFHAFLSTPTPLRDFDRTFMCFLPGRRSESIYFKSGLNPVIR